MKIFLCILAFMFTAFVEEEPEGAISGKVLQSTIQPVEGAIVKAILFNKVVGMDTTDEDGSYTIKPLVPDRNYIMVTTHDSFRTVWMDSVMVLGDRTTYQNFNLADRGYQGKEVDSVHYKFPTLKSIIKSENIHPSVKSDCPKNYKNKRCPVCKKAKTVIPVVYDQRLGRLCHSELYSIDWYPYVHYYPGGYNEQECVPKYYCKKDSLLF